MRVAALLLLLATALAPAGARGLEFRVNPNDPPETVRPGDTLDFEFLLLLDQGETVRGVQLEFRIRGAIGPVQLEQVPDFLAGAIMVPWALSSTVGQRAGAPANEIVLIHASGIDVSLLGPFPPPFVICGILSCPYDFGVPLGRATLVAGNEPGPVWIELLSPVNGSVGLVANICANAAGNCLLDNEPTHQTNYTIVPEAPMNFAWLLLAIGLGRLRRFAPAALVLACALWPAEASALFVRVNLDDGPVEVRAGDPIVLDFELELGPTEVVRGIQLEFRVNGAVGPVSYRQVPDLLAGALMVPWGLSSTVSAKVGAPANEVVMIHANGTDQSITTLSSLCPLSLLPRECTEFDIGGVTLVAGADPGPIEIELLSPPNATLGTIANICSTEAGPCTIENPQVLATNYTIVPEAVMNLAWLWIALGLVRWSRNAVAVLVLVGALWPVDAGALFVRVNVDEGPVEVGAGDPIVLDFELELGPTERVRGIQLEFRVRGAVGPVSYEQVPDLLAGAVMAPWGLSSTVSAKVGAPANEIVMIHANGLDQSLNSCLIIIGLLDCVWSLGGVTLVAGDVPGPVEIELLSPPNTSAGQVANFCSSAAGECTIDNPQVFATNYTIVPEASRTMAMALAASLLLTGLVSRRARRFTRARARAYDRGTAHERSANPRTTP